MIFAPRRVENRWRCRTLREWSFQRIDHLRESLEWLRIAIGSKLRTCFRLRPTRGFPQFVRSMRCSSMHHAPELERFVATRMRDGASEFLISR